VRAFVASEPAALPVLREVMHRDGSLLEQDGARFTLARGAVAEISYRIDLDAVAAAAQDPDVCLRSGEAWIAAASTFLLQPQPVASGAVVSLRVASTALGFATGLRPAGEGYRIYAHEIPTASYAVFGEFERDELRLPGPLTADPRLRPAGAASEAQLEIVTLPGKLKVSRATRRRWVRDAALAVTDFWRGLPMDRALVAIVPMGDHDGVAHGKVVAAGGATVALRLGEHADERALYRDWILVHELFHLGFPSFWGEGKWLDEGLATYYEPIIRARAGWRSEEALWREFAYDMRQGLDAVEQTGVERAQSYRGIYWGGAILALYADVRARRLSAGRRGLEDGLRAVLARGGNASQVWKLDDVIAVIDRELGAPILRELSRAHGHAGRPVDLNGLLTELGVTPTRGWVELDDASPLSSVRKAILLPPG
jgi:hypothetical protein